MKRSSPAAIVLYVAASLVVCVTAGAETKQRKPQNKPQVPAAQPSEEQMMQNTVPGAAHSALAKLSGEYTTATKVHDWNQQGRWKDHYLRGQL